MESECVKPHLVIINTITFEITFNVFSYQRCYTCYATNASHVTTMLLQYIGVKIYVLKKQVQKTGCQQVKNIHHFTWIILKK